MKISKIPVEWGWENEEWEIDDLCHAYRVDVYDRNEDAKSGTHVVVEDGSVRMNNDLCGNASPRRTSIVISFWSENGYKFKMGIYQHKGAEFISFFDKEELADGEFGMYAAERKDD